MPLPLLEFGDLRANDVVSLPGEAATTIAKKLHSASSVSALARYVNPEAHDSYMRGRFLWFANRFDQAAQYFHKATGLQPDYALGWSGLADCYGTGTMHGTYDPRIALPQMDGPAARAIALDPSLPQAHVSMAGALFFYHWDWVRADREVRSAIELDPRFAEAYHLRARIITAINHGDEAIQVQKKEMDLDPFARPWGMAETYYNVHQYDAAIEDAQLRLGNSPDNILLLHEFPVAAFGDSGVSGGSGFGTPKTPG